MLVFLCLRDVPSFDRLRPRHHGTNRGARLAVSSTISKTSMSLVDQDLPFGQSALSRTTNMRQRIQALSGDFSAYLRVRIEF